MKMLLQVLKQRRDGLTVQVNAKREIIAAIEQSFEEVHSVEGSTIDADDKALVRASLPNISPISD